MFAQAGMNTEDARFVCAAMIRRRGWPAHRWARSYLFAWPSGDLAWCGNGGASWGHQIVIGNFIQAPRCDRPREALPR